VYDKKPAGTHRANQLVLSLFPSCTEQSVCVSLHALLCFAPNSNSLQNSTAVPVVVGAPSPLRGVLVAAVLLLAKIVAL